MERVVPNVEFHFGDLFPRVGFIVTNLETESRAVVQLIFPSRQVVSHAGRARLVN